MKHLIKIAVAVCAVLGFVVGLGLLLDSEKRADYIGIYEE